MVTFTPDKFAQLKIANPRLWWPAQVGTQNLYPLKLQFETGGAVSDESAHALRHPRSDFQSSTRRITACSSINGKNILIRGAATPSTCCCAPRPSARRPS